MEPVAASPVRGVATVSEYCTAGACFADDSLIKTQILSGERRPAAYRVTLVKSDCARPSSTGLELGAGETAASPGDATQVDIPIIALTGGEYAIVVRASSGAVVACGVIRRSGPV